MSDPLLVSPVPGVSLKRVEANGISMRYAEAGSGPLVLFCHGWPESWYSWRHQLLAVAAAGYRAVAPDMRGYGGTDAPDAIDQYTLFHIVGDMVELVKTLGEEQAVIVGHDWGAPAAWHAALWRPDVFRAVAGMSVPWSPPGYTDLLSALAKLGITTFYIQYFQKPGVAEAELQKDVRNSLRRVYFTAGGELREKGKGFAVLPPGGGLLDNTVDPETLPPWMSEADLDYYTAEFTRAGFRGGLNWYRNLTRTWSLAGPWRGQPITVPALFIAGSRDGVLRFPAAQSQLDAFPRTLPKLRGKHILEDAGHWIQQERAETVNALLVDFLKGL
ncbi:MAG: alpha/beta fold hydrolase [Reyranellaceae bacterium]